jgi:integrase
VRVAITPIRGVKVYEVKGKLYCYHRATKTPIKAPYGSVDFLVEVRELDKLAQSPGAIKRQIHGTLGWLIVEHKKSSAWTNLSDRSHRDYQPILNWLSKIDHKPLHEFTPKRCLALHELAFKEKKRAFANRLLEFMKKLFKWAVPREHVESNPFREIKKIARPKHLPKANRAWSQSEMRTVLGEATGGLRVILALCMFACFRVGLAVTAPWGIYDPEEGFEFQFKTGDTHWLRAHSELRKILDETPRVGSTIVVSSRGEPYSESGAEYAFRVLRRRLEREGRIRPGLTFHGLRHTAGKKTLADLGADPRIIAAMLGQTSMAMAIHYSQEADRRRKGRAAVQLLEQAWNDDGPAGEHPTLLDAPIART